jgi:hypothetical protein
MTSQQFILKAAIGVYLIVLVGTAYFTRAPRDESPEP